MLGATAAQRAAPDNNGKATGWVGGEEEGQGIYRGEGALIVEGGGSFRQKSSGRPGSLVYNPEASGSYKTIRFGHHCHDLADAQIDVLLKPPGCVNGILGTTVHGRT